MTIDKNLEGAWRICENINGYLETQVYYFYTKKDAIRKFRQYKKNLTNQQKGTMKTQKIEDVIKDVIDLKKEDYHVCNHNNINCNCEDFDLVIDKLELFLYEQKKYA